MMALAFFLLIIAGLIVAVIAVYFLLKKQKAKAKTVQAARTLATTRQRVTQATGRRLSPLERSWQFLTKITEAVMTKFPKKDQKRIIDLGSTLMDSGLKYQHLVDYRAGTELSRGTGKKRGKTSPTHE